ncbi:uncharacterized protein KGF55_000064 [Candida pseudojiufengensis]|uniref:uncharacterized protein n=1 Tax=Candida pseudojiufengensis TaxID=497109 RepID=UPI0022253E18|nr:uncharacterized protein KGF55_000064 [Candida pseudojiufengensis]KAI5967832.1 hypothetical protein KGF55_000064 [Candida pseudojiufengensis]
MNRSTTKKSKYLKFPFSTCNHDHLKDSNNLITHGLNLTIQLGILNLDDFELANNGKDNILTKETKSKTSICSNREYLHNEESSEDDYETDDEESLMDYEHEPPSPILIPTDLPKSSLRRGSLTRRISEDAGYCASLSICHNKIENMINEYFPRDVVNDEKTYIEIKNYIINSIIQNEKNIDKFLGKIINHKFKNELSDIIRSIFIEKYVEIKLENLIDFFYNFLNLNQIMFKKFETLQNPNLYDKYYKIWKLDKNDFKFYEEEYFLEYFHNSGKSITTIEHIMLQNGFLINYRRFVQYFTKDFPNYYDDEEIEDDEEEKEETKHKQSNYTYTSLSNYDALSRNNSIDSNLSLDSLTYTPKCLRFNEEINVININRYLPVDQVLYEKFLKSYNQNS